MANTAAKDSLTTCTQKLREGCETVAAAKAALWRVMIAKPEGAAEINPNDMVQFTNAYAQISNLLPQLLRAAINLEGLIGPIK